LAFVIKFLVPIAIKMFFILNKKKNNSQYRDTELPHLSSFCP